MYMTNLSLCREKNCNLGYFNRTTLKLMNIPGQKEYTLKNITIG